MEQSKSQTSSQLFQPQIRSQDQALIQSIHSNLAEFAAAFSKADIRAVGSFFAEDATLINPIGERAQGREVIQRVAQKDLETFLKGSRSEFKLENARFLSDGLVLIDANQSVTGVKTQDGKEMPPFTFHVVILARKAGDRWMWLDARPYSLMQPLH